MNTKSNSSATVRSGFNRLVPAVVCAMLAGLTVLALMVVFHPGGALLGKALSDGAAPAVKMEPVFDVTLHLLLALIAVIVLGRVLSGLLSYVKQPPVIGEILAGILIGPSFLGPTTSAFILPSAVMPALGAVAQFGAILYMFIVGLETDASLLVRRPYATMMVSNFSIVIPFVLGALLAIRIYPVLGAGTASFTPFALFFSIGMSVTAFPVLARIVTDLRIAHTELGLTALASAAFNDVVAWCLLALIVSYIHADAGGGVIVLLEVVFYVLGLVLIVRPLIVWFARDRPLGEEESNSAVAWVFVALLLSTLATEAIGIHAIFGAFMLGAIIPKESAISQQLPRQLQVLVTSVLLPAFFALTGARTRVDIISGSEQWMICFVIIVVAMLGKLGGTILAGRLSGFDWRISAGLGALMNTRGLMELIVLNLGLDLRIISPALFSMMVLMTLVTTIMAAPLLSLLKLDRRSGFGQVPDGIYKFVEQGRADRNPEIVERSLKEGLSGLDGIDDEKKSRQPDGTAV